MRNAASHISTALIEAGKASAREMELADIHEITGHTNHVFDVRVASGRYAVKLRRGPRESRDFQSEQMATYSSWRLGIGPEPVWSSPEGDTMVTRWIAESRPLETGDFGIASTNITRAAALLKTFHSGAETLLTRIQPGVVIARLVVEHQQRLPECWRDIAGPVKAAQKSLGRDQQLVPSHGDPSPQNFLATKDRLYLIDWEYAGMAPAAVDLGYLAVEADLDLASQLPLLIDGYDDPSVTIRSVLEAMLLAGVMNALWFTKGSDESPGSKPARTLIQRWSANLRVAKALQRLI